MVWFGLIIVQLCFLCHTHMRDEVALSLRLCLIKA